ncbi:T9SS type A sorting domain-containing protein [Neotamlana laminarinivorans]|uniref:T9SS type A sorting domain-containing protein n=1 Tax=Neotamlana laminarinivorans TaxID=2883124 RepID=A0A9X1I1K1_9FLAO|nr:T9SS type A sorting domain-containing protein [Tamlana laminarinivorans]MCB4798512.1 T9SS type A sorting domain-containing protein [Tamlana laminarinivorans]
MKKFYSLFLIFLMANLSFGQDLIITGAFDGPLSGGVPKAVEIYVINDIADLSAYGFGSANNGGGTDGEEFTFSGSATAGDFLYLATEVDGFTAYFGFAPDFTSGSASINGDDALELFYNGTAYDVFGDINTDGTGEAWDYLDGWAYRVSDSSPSTTFTLADWTFSGADAVDGCTTNASCGSQFPLGTFTFSTLSTKQNQIEGFTAYPNPTSLGYVNITSKSTSVMDVAVFDLLGKQVLSNKVTSNKLNVSGLNSGIYVMKVTQNDAVSTQKLVIK